METNNVPAGKDPAANFAKIFPSLKNYVSPEDIELINGTTKTTKSEEVPQEEQKPEEILTHYKGIDLSTEKDVEKLLAGPQLSTICFEGLNIGTLIFDHEQHFKKFAIKFSKSLRQLQLIRSTLSMGRFIELLACLSLDELTIHDPGYNPYMLQTDMQIAKWDFFIPFFIKVLENLKGFDLAGIYPSIPENTQKIFFKHLKSLNYCKFYTSGNISKEALLNLLQNNYQSLHVLSLYGTLIVDEEILTNLSKLKLNELTLGKSNIKNGMFDKFLESQENSLEKLIFREMLIPQMYIPSTLNIKQLQFYDCEIGHFEVFQAFSNLSKSLELMKIHFTTPSTNKNLTGMHLKKFYSDIKFENLHTLTFRCIQSAFSRILPVLESATKNLVELTILRCKIVPIHMQNIFELGKLEVLRLVFCDLDFHHFKEEQAIDNTKIKTLAQLTKLKQLHLGKNLNLEDEPMLTHVLKLKDLEVLCLVGTKFTRLGLTRILEQFAPNKNGPTKFKKISCTRCVNCKVTMLDFEEMSRKFYPIEIDVDTI